MVPLTEGGAYAEEEVYGCSDSAHGVADPAADPQVAR
jgi:hypothetical protein